MDLHPIERARERYGLILTIDDLNALGDRVRAKQVGIINRDSRAITCESMIGTVLVRYVYDIESGHIVTFLPRRTCADLSRSYESWRLAVANGTNRRSKMRNKFNR